MLSKKLFKEALEELEIMFDGFNLTEGKIKISYRYCKYLTDSQWKKKIENCIKYCRKIPTLADILDLKGYYEDEGWEGTPVFEVDDYKHKPISKKTQKEIDKIFKGKIIRHNKLKEEE